MALMSLRNSHKAGLLGSMGLIFSNPGLRVSRRDFRPHMEQKVAKCGVAFSFLSGDCIGIILMHSNTGLGAPASGCTRCL